MLKRVVAFAVLGILLVPAALSAQTPVRETTRAVRPVVKAAQQLRENLARIRRVR